MASTLTLIRHGDTAWSLSGQHTGRSDIELTPRGEEAARVLAAALGATKFTHVLTSPRVRALRTCTLAGLGAQAKIEPDLAEWDYGEYEGLRSSDIRRQRPGWNIYRDGCPGGETPDIVSARADRLIQRLRALDGEIALFSHGHFGTVLAARWVGLAVLHGQGFLFGPANRGVLGFSPNHPDIPVIALWNATPAMLPPP